MVTTSGRKTTATTMTMEGRRLPVRRRQGPAGSPPQVRHRQADARLLIPVSSNCRLSKSQIRVLSNLAFSINQGAEMNKHSKVGKDSRTCRRLDELCDKNAKRKGAVWTTCEQHDMRRAWERGLSVGSIGLIHGRTAGAIASRLRQMHLIDDKIYMNFGIFPDFTIEMCGAQSKVERLIHMGLMCSTGRSELVAEIPAERRWPQAEAYMGYVPGAAVGLSKDITPLEFYYPQALAKSAIGPMIREGRLYHYGGMPTWNLDGIAKQFAGQDTDMNLREAQRVAESSVITGFGTNALIGDWTVPSEFVIKCDKLKSVELEAVVKPGIYYRPPEETNLPKSNWSITANCLPSRDRSVVTDMTIQVQDLEAALHDKAFIESSAFVRALKNAGFQLQALDVQSSQCVNKHADTQTTQEQDMQEKIQNAIRRSRLCPGTEKRRLSASSLGCTIFSMR
ncbi:hypothetical protein [Achromobacter phage kwar_LB4]|nr:hypothetical protein [Achromobacter phage kwar_LB4]